MIVSTEDKINIMTKSLQGVPIQCKKRIGLNNDWKDIYAPDWDFIDYEYRVKPEVTLPKTWEEFCEIHPIIQRNEATFKSCSKIWVFNELEGKKRSPKSDRDVLPNRQTAEAVLALCQLIQLRDCYNDGWVPDWYDDRTRKFVILSDQLNPHTTEAFTANRILAFKTEELRDEFLKNFRELIETARELL